MSSREWKDYYIPSNSQQRRIQQKLESACKNNKIRYDSKICKKIQEGISIKSLPESIIDDIKFNLITILMSDLFSDYYNSEFYRQLYQIYISGHLPCGWEGKYPSGRMIVF